MGHPEERIRRALGAAERVPEPPGPEAGPPVSLSDQIELFAAALEQAAGRFLRAADDVEARRLVDRLAAGRSIVDARDPPEEAAIRAAGVGVDTADLLIAETGTVVRTYASRSQARLTLVPPVVVFLARPASLVPDLAEALAHAGERHDAGRAYTVLVTGPSRTADIEKQLVIPAHGPRELVVVLVGG